ncbi:MAG: tRNA (guanosine(46)-N7)-methyltransferase TrmB [Nocardioides sp.]|uniref:tRNA (guanosine(46)-N7)-methyltransferase TrmB n=1 Tax=Nocardioides sp. TaxID=35761 RepID=UPI002398D506|nr:tRNA (guanosine(46)-N7)-methyltransferase TrmB [Nocardioides sp.]MDE0776273.1 tRNA (guanosine(46)-N7)-methyltransferase TrmB [Nocardioides sp.]
MNHANDSAPARPHQKVTEDGRRLREVLTYSRRGSRFTPRQARAWEAHHDAWVIPDEAVDAPGFAFAEVFAREAPLIVEIGSGVGEATAALAAARPECNILALEVWRPGVAETLHRLAEAGVGNVRLCSVDAVWTAEHLLPAGSLAELWTFFPDPWHKARHHKRRLVTPANATLLAGLLRPGGVWRLATDWAEYADVMLEVLDAEPTLSGGRVERWADRPVTRFERRGLAAGREPIDLRYVRAAS